MNRCRHLVGVPLTMEQVWDVLAERAHKAIDDVVLVGPFNRNGDIEFNLKEARYLDDGRLDTNESSVAMLRAVRDRRAGGRGKMKERLIKIFVGYPGKMLYRLGRWMLGIAPLRCHRNNQCLTSA